MILKRPASERGRDERGWIVSAHTFSFENYYDAQFMGYQTMRVLNEVTLQGGKSLPTQFHRDMEILTYVMEGVLEFKDQTGKTHIIRPGEIQVINAGTGFSFTHSNLSHQLPVHFIQAWVYPENHSVPPEMSQRIFSSAAKWAQWCLLVSRNSREGSLRIHQNLDLYTTLLEDQEAIRFDAFPEHAFWIQVLKGNFIVQGMKLEAGDGASLTNETSIDVKCLESGELLLFDLS